MSLNIPDINSDEVAIRVIDELKHRLKARLPLREQRPPGVTTLTPVADALNDMLNRIIVHHKLDGDPHAFANPPEAPTSTRLKVPGRYIHEDEVKEARVRDYLQASAASESQELRTLGDEIDSGKRCRHGVLLDNHPMRCVICELQEPIEGLRDEEKKFDVKVTFLPPGHKLGSVTYVPSMPDKAQLVFEGTIADVTVRSCIDCGALVAGGPTRCGFCANNVKADGTFQGDGKADDWPVGRYVKVINPEHGRCGYTGIIKAAVPDRGQYSVRFHRDHVGEWVDAADLEWVDK